MKNLKTILGVVLVTVLTMTSCSKDESAEPMVQDTMVQDTTVNDQVDDIVNGDLPTNDGYDSRLDSIDILVYIYSDYTDRMWGVKTEGFVRDFIQYHQSYGKTKTEILTLLDFSLTVMSYSYSDNFNMNYFSYYTDREPNNSSYSRIMLWEMNYQHLIKEVKYYDYFEKYHTTEIMYLD